MRGGRNKSQPGCFLSPEVVVLCKRSSSGTPRRKELQSGYFHARVRGMCMPPRSAGSLAMMSFPAIVADCSLSCARVHPHTHTHTHFMNHFIACDHLFFFKFFLNTTPLVHTSKAERLKSQTKLGAQASNEMSHGNKNWHTRVFRNSAFLEHTSDCYHSRSHATRDCRLCRPFARFSQWNARNWGQPGR